MSSPIYNNFYYKMIDFYVFIQVILVHSLDSALTRYCSIRGSSSVPLVFRHLPRGVLTDNSVARLLSSLQVQGSQLGNFAKVGLESEGKAVFKYYIAANYR